ncbi:hypothetical protein ACVIEM_001275 [Rhizobium leguminosarum]
MRTRRRQAEIPGAQVPDDRGNQQRENHGKAGAGADLQDQFHRQQGQNAEGDGAARGQHAEEVEKAGPDDGEFRRHGTGVDHGGDGIGRIMETVDEFKAERDEQRKA